MNKYQTIEELVNKKFDPISKNVNNILSNTILTNPDKKSIESLVNKSFNPISEKIDNIDKQSKKLWSIEGLNCFQIHTVELMLSEGGKLQYGTAIAPDNYRHSHTWIEKDGKIIDLFNWTEHKSEGYFDLPDQEHIDEWLHYTGKYCEDFENRINEKYKFVFDPTRGTFKTKEKNIITSQIEEIENEE